MRAKALGYGVVLALVIASIAVQMSFPATSLTRFTSIVIQAATLVAAVRVADVRGGTRIAALVAIVAVIAAALTWLIHGDITPAPSAIVNLLLVAVAPVAIARGLLRDLRRDHEVTLATLQGVLAIYLLLGMLFSSIYGVIGAADGSQLFAEVADPTREDELYFSFVTLCTVGYGDLTPAGNLARSFSVAEMLFGQIYLVTIVSLIVGNLTARRRA
jgi:Ion channel